LKVRRRHERFVRRLETEFTGDGKTYRAISSDFSRYGLFIRTNHAFIPGTELDILVHTPNGTICHLKGLVRRSLKTPVVSLKNGMGIELISRDSAYVKFLKEFDPTEGDEPPSSTAPDPSQATQQHGQHNPDDHHQKPVPPAQEFRIIVCRACEAKNKVRSERLTGVFKCGKCGAPLSPQV